jgi:hypothetical protein
MPRPIMENMPHIRPSIYSVPEAKDKDFELLVINDGIDSVYAGDGKHVERIELGESIAENLKNMICNSQLANGENAYPGVFWVHGEHTKEDIKTKFTKELEKAKLVQLNWYRNLVREADDVWAKFHQHRTISDLMRFAASALKLNREWLINTEDAEAIACPACGKDLPNKDVTICATCHTIIKPEEHAKKFAPKKELVAK